MTAKAHTALRKLALSYPETEEGVVCERSAFKARGKSFLFMGVTDQGFDVMVKLSDSLAAATQRAAKAPQSYKVGANGWVTATFCNDETPPTGLLEAWIDESFRLLAPKALLAADDSTTKKKAAKKKAASGY